jgi:hypothetical protein
MGHLKILQLIGHINPLNDMLSNTPMSIILSMHHLSHEHASVSLRGPLEMLLNLSHESLTLVGDLGRAPLMAVFIVWSIIINATMSDLSH